MSKKSLIYLGAGALALLVLAFIFRDTLRLAIDFALHIDRHLEELAQNYGPWLYGILFLIIFCETGLVVTPILPGDSLLFITGAIAAQGHLDIYLICLLLIAAAVLGDMVNFYIGKYFGVKLLEKNLIRRSHYEKAHGFYEKYGGRTIIIARFMPIVRTLAPFVAGISRMDYRRFSAYNVIGALVWIISITVLGYFFGSLPFIKNNLSKVVLLIIVLSILPAIVEFIRVNRKK